MSVTAIPHQAADQAAEAPPAKGGKKKLVIILLAVLLIGGGAYWFVLRPKPETAPKPGEVMTLEPIQINLAAAHYLRVGIALQLVAGAHEVDGSKALDATIEVFSGKPMAEVNDPKGRHKLKKELEHHLEELYHHEVLGVYFTEFVTQ